LGKGSIVLDSHAQARFATLVLPHLDAAFILARWLLRSGAVAEDAAQEAMKRRCSNGQTYSKVFGKLGDYSREHRGTTSDDHFIDHR
jgi:DNA-directed RNA polymerase specialized sigma24 family protein